MKKLMTLVLALALIFGLMGFVNPTAEALDVDLDAVDVELQDEYLFIMVPKAVHPWFDVVLQGAEEQAAVYEEVYGVDIEIEFRAPDEAQVTEQNRILEEAMAVDPDGITVDPLDAEANRAVFEDILDLDIPFVVFDSFPPEGMEEVPHVGNDFGYQARLAAEELVDRLDGEGQVAIMDGAPEAPNHQARTEAYRDYFAQYEDIEVVAEALAMDDIETAQQEALSIFVAHPDLDGMVFSDAAGPIGAGRAAIEEGIEDEVELIPIEDLDQILELFQEGVYDWSVCTRPRMQGQWFVKILMQENLGFQTPSEVDTGVNIVTEEDIPEDIDEYVTD